MWQKESEKQRKEPMTKARKALDWALSCLIRMPVFAVFLAMILFAIAVAVLIISPESIEKALLFLRNGV